MATVRQYDGDNAIERWRHCDDTTAKVRYDYRIVAPVDMQLTTSLSLPDVPWYQYLCRWQSEAAKNATRVGSKFTCRMDNRNITNNIQLTLEFGVKVINTGSVVILTEAPFLLYSCSNFKKCVECTLTVGANFTIYNCTKLAEGGCNYCKALNTSIYKCAWDSSAHIC
ncbi:hypothetical protein DPMN_172910, partial [Dreissena polymorpha]